MKRYSLIVLALTLTLNANELAWVDTQVEAIKPPRKGMSSANIASIKNPFIFLDKNKNKTKEKAKPDTPSLDSSKKTVDSVEKVVKVSDKLILSAIINSSALINGKWYKLNDKVYTYKLSSVDRTSVVLTEGKTKLILSTYDTKRNLKFNNK